MFFGIHAYNCKGEEDCQAARVEECHGAMLCGALKVGRKNLKLERHDNTVKGNGCGLLTTVASIVNDNTLTTIKYNNSVN
jgi:hypothetical protein